MRYSRYSGGFTLLELSAVLVISGLLLVAGMQSYDGYVKRQRFTETYERMNAIKASFSDFTNASNRYPCPADPSLDMTDPGAGIENCALMSFAVPIGTCVGGVCKVAGARDTAADGDTDTDPVLTGGVPFRTLRWASATASAADWVTSHGYVAGDIVWESSIPYKCMSDHVSAAAFATDLGAGMWGPLEGDKRANTMHMELVRDAWGHQFTYAVSGYMAQTATFDTSHGAVAVRNEFGRTLVQPTDGAHYALVSHGDNGFGAHNVNGSITFPCPASPALEGNNCNGGSVFIDGLRSIVSGVGYFDDLVTYEAYVISRLWDYSKAFGFENTLYNLNKGNVGVGTDNPAYKMDVIGPVRGDDVNTPLLCDYTHDSGNAYCFDPDILGGVTGIGCTTATANNIKLVTGIAGQNGANPGYVLCSGDIPLPVLTPGGQTCPAGQFIVGVTLLGTIICETP
ncbi:MAG: prepilin-type N-terminal cleavage/methylation domain-containing protein [Pseudomonadota bacterium]